MDVRPLERQPQDPPPALLGLFDARVLDADGQGRIVEFQPTQVVAPEEVWTKHLDVLEREAQEDVRETRLHARRA